MTDDTQQTHPLYAIDRDQVDAVLGHDGTPGPQQLTTIAALFSRYADFPGADDIRDELAAAGIELEDSREGTRWRRL